MNDQTQCNSDLSIPKARVLLDEMGAYLRFARDRIEDTAYRLPVSDGREEMLELRQPYDVATKMWQVLTEVKTQLDEQIERVEAAARVTSEELVGEENIMTLLEAAHERWWDEAREEGHQEGRKEGHRLGRRQGKATIVLRLLELKFGSMDPSVRHRIRRAEPADLERWAQRLLTADTPDEVFS